MRRAIAVAVLGALALTLALASGAATGPTKFSVRLPRAGKGKMKEIVVTGRLMPGFRGRAVNLGVRNLKKLPPDIRAFGAVSKPIRSGGKTKVYAFVAINNLKGVAHGPAGVLQGDALEGIVFGASGWSEYNTDVTIVQDGCKAYLKLKRDGEFTGDLYVYLGPWPTPPKKGFGYVTKSDPNCP